MCSSAVRVLGLLKWGHELTMLRMKIRLPAIASCDVSTLKHEAFNYLHGVPCEVIRPSAGLIQGFNAADEGSLPYESSCL